MENLFLTIWAIVGAYIVVAMIVVIAYYIISSLAYMKMLRTFGYARPWMAWIPLANWFAFAEVAVGNAEQITLFGKVTIPVIFYKLWWVLMLICASIPLVGSFLATVIRVVFLGNCFTKIYAKLEYTSEQEQQVIGYLSGLLPIIAVVKFLTSK